MVEKNELITQVMNIEYVPNFELKTYDIDTTPSFPIQNLASMGSAVKPLTEMISKFASQGGSGFYYVNTKGSSMFKSSGGFIGSLKGVNGAVGGGQAIMNPIAINPATMAASCAVMAIEHKINQITEGQRDIVDFLLYQEQAKIKGNINTLIDVLNNYKYNIDNEKYKNNKHILVQSIKNESEKSILLVESLVNKMINKKSGLHFNKKVEESLKESINRLNDYQLGIYQLAFSSFLEIMLLENFDEGYINSVMNNIKNHKEKYSLACENVKSKIKELSETSIQNELMLGVSKVSAGMSRLIEKTPLGKTQLDENLLSTSQKILESKEDYVNKKVDILSDVNANLIEPFEKTIEMIKLIYSDNYSIIFDDKNVYLDFEKTIQ